MKKGYKDMSNFEIITTEAVAAGIYTKEQIEEMVKATGTIPLHTFAEWKRLGYKVRRANTRNSLAASGSGTTRRKPYR